MTAPVTVDDPAELPVRLCATLTAPVTVEVPAVVAVSA